MYINYWLGFGASKIFIFHVQYKSIIIIFSVQMLFIIIIHVSAHLSLLSIIIISHIRYASIIIIIYFHLVIFHKGAWIFLGSNIINDNSILTPPCPHDTPSYKCAVIIASLLWLIFFDKRRVGTVSRKFWSGISWCYIGFLICVCQKMR